MTTKLRYRRVFTETWQYETAKLAWDKVACGSWSIHKLGKYRNCRAETVVNCVIKFKFDVKELLESNRRNSQMKTYSLTGKQSAKNYSTDLLKG